MATQTQPANPSQWTEDDLVALMKTITEEGGTVGSLHGIGKQELEAAYAIAYSFYTQGKFDEAAKIFAFLCFYSHAERKFWKGLGASKQMLKDYTGAAQAYAVMTMLDIDDPEPGLYAAECFIALGRGENAQQALEGAIYMASQNKKYGAIQSRAQTLLDALNKGKDAHAGAR